MNTSDGDDFDLYGSLEDDFQTLNFSTSGIPNDPNTNIDNIPASVLSNRLKEANSTIFLLQDKIQKLEAENSKMKLENEILTRNISSLWKTSINELEKKNKLISVLQDISIANSKDVYIDRKQQTSGKKFQMFSIPQKE